MDDEQEAFRSPPICKLTGVSFRQLDYWARIGLIEPSIEPAVGSGSARLYSFKDVLCVQLMATLLNAGIGFEFSSLAVRKFKASATAPRTLNFTFDGIEITIYLTKIKNDLRKKIEAMRQPAVTG